jgi:hypothetical protein
MSDKEGEEAAPGSAKQPTVVEYDDSWLNDPPEDEPPEQPVTSRQPSAREEVGAATSVPKPPIRPKAVTTVAVTILGAKGLSGAGVPATTTAEEPMNFKSPACRCGQSVPCKWRRERARCYSVLNDSYW